MKYPERTAFIISNPGLIPEILNSRPAAFHIFLLGGGRAASEHVTVCPPASFHDTAVQICRAMAQRRLCRIVTDQPNQPLQQKVSELINGSCGFALGGSVRNALENLWRNLPHLPRSSSLDSLQDRLQGLPCIIVASGPSLEKNVHMLNDLKSKAVLIACGSALGPLRRRGIDPHYEIVIDPNPAMYETLKPYLDGPTCFALSLMAHHGISRECTGPKMYFPVNFESKALEDLKRFTGINTVLPAMASVATSALFFSLHAGCDPIIFVGQDLCYSDGRTAIDGAPGPESAHMLETIDGRRVPASAAMKEAFDFYADFIPTIKDRKIINATEGGAGIKGADHLSLAQTADMHLKHDIYVPEHSGAIDCRRVAPRLKELRKSLDTMSIKAGGFKRKIGKLLEEGAAPDAVESKIVDWFDSLRISQGYEYLAPYCDWALYSACAEDGLKPKLAMLDNVAYLLQQQTRLLSDAILHLQTD